MFNQNLSATTPKDDILHDKPILVKQLIVLSLEMLLAFPLGLALTRFNSGGIAWLFGGIAAGAMVFQGCRFYDYSPKQNRTARKVGMALVGLNVGFAIAHGNFASVVSAIPIFAVLTFFLLLCGSLIGYFYSRLSQTNILTAMLATVPGGVGPMSSIAADYNKNVTLVALVQSLRVTTVVLLIPLLARTISGTQIIPQTFNLSNALLNLDLSHLGLLFFALLIGGLGIYLATSLKIPASDFFGALVIGIAFNPLVSSLPFVDAINFSPPPLVNLIGQMLLGITIGEYWGKKPTLDKKIIGYTFLSVAMTLVAGLIAATLAWELTSWDWLTCLLVTAPGGSAEMILVALALDHNVEIVTGGHLVRLIAINASLPLWVFLFRHLDNQASEPAEVFEQKC
nr:AbrB family transcriptional regulator [Iningainema tapete]